MNSSFDPCDKKHRGKLGSTSWTFCMGAGVSMGITPSWDELTRLIYNEVYGKKLDSQAFNEMLDNIGWGLDSIIQAASNQYLSTGKNIKQFNELMDKLLYGQLRDKAQTYSLERQLVISLNNPREVDKKSTIELTDFFLKEYGNTSIVRLAIFFAKNFSKIRLPFAIVTFNADTLFHSLVELFQRRDHFNGPPPHGHPDYFLTTVLRPLGNTPVLKVPIFHIHGAIKPVPLTHVHKSSDIRDKLVFLEKDYLKVVTMNSNWPQSLFIYLSQMSHFVLFGVSMSDPNLRRWLSQSFEMLELDLQQVIGTKRHQPPFIWLTKKSKSQDQNILMIDGVSHLGIKIGWLDDWSQISECFENLCSV